MYTSSVNLAKLYGLINHERNNSHGVSGMGPSTRKDVAAILPGSGKVGNSSKVQSDKMSLDLAKMTSVSLLSLITSRS